MADIDWLGLNLDCHNTSDETFSRALFCCTLEL